MTDIAIIERSLHRFIPLIRFYNIEATDFFYKVYKYKDILPQNLILDLSEFHIFPNTKPKGIIAPMRISKLGSKHTAIFSHLVGYSEYEKICHILLFYV